MQLCVYIRKRYDYRGCFNISLNLILMTVIVQAMYTGLTSYLPSPILLALTHCYCSISQHLWDTDTEICLLKFQSTEHSSVDELAQVHLIQLLQLPTANESPILELRDLRLHCERREHEVWDGRRLCLPRNEPGGRRN